MKQSLLDKIIEYIILLFVFLVPWQARLILSNGSINEEYWEYGTKSLYATEVILFAVLLFIIAQGAIYIAKTKPKFNARRLYSPAGALMVLIIWAGLSVFWSYDASIAFEKWIVLIEAIVVFLVLSLDIVSFKKLFWIVILSGLIQASFAIVQFFLQWIPESTLFGMSSQNAQNLGVSVVETDFRRWLRAYGSFPHPNILGGWLILSLVLLTNQMKHQSRRALDTLNYPMFIILLFGLLATFSRSAWFGFGIFLIIFVLRLFARHTWVQAIKIILISSITVLCFYSVFPKPMNTRLGLQGRLETKSSAEHINSIDQGLKIVQQNFLFGTGIGNYDLAVFNQIDNSQESWFYQPVHNVILLIFAELGIIGIMFIIIFSIWHIIALLREKKAFILIYFIPLIVISMFDHYFWSLYSGMMISAVYFGVIILMLKNKKDF